METFQRVIYGMPLFNEHNFEKVRTFVADGTARASEHERARASMSEFECEPN